MKFLFGDILWFSINILKEKVRFNEFLLIFWSGWVLLAHHRAVHSNLKKSLKHITCLLKYMVYFLSMAKKYVLSTKLTQFLLCLSRVSGLLRRPETRFQK
jgi:hypothetical protein